MTRATRNRPSDGPNRDEPPALVQSWRQRCRPENWHVGDAIERGDELTELDGDWRLDHRRRNRALYEKGWRLRQTWAGHTSQSWPHGSGRVARRAGVTKTKRTEETA